MQINSGVTKTTVFCVGAFGMMERLISCLMDMFFSVPPKVADLVNVSAPDAL